MNRQDETGNGVSGSADGAHTSKGRRILGIVVALLIAVVVVWAWSAYGRPGLESLVKAILRD